MSGHDDAVLVVAGGLAGLACAFELTDRGVPVLLLEAGERVGGRTASWSEDGVPVESGLHRFLGFFSAVPRLLERAGVDLGAMVCWEDEVEIRLPDGGPRGLVGPSPLHEPMRTIGGLVGNNDLLRPVDEVTMGRFLVAGLLDYVRRPDELDRRTGADHAKAHGVSDRATCSSP